MTPEALLLIANLTLARKPGRGPRVYPDPLVSPEDAAVAFGVPEVQTSELRRLRALYRLVVELVDRLLDGQELESQAAALTALAQPSRAAVVLEVAHARLLPRLEWSDADLVSRLARQVILELGEVDPSRLRRCERSECHLLFYDRTRSNTQRWHAEAPCGQRERQRRHRAGRRTQSGEDRG